MEILKDWLAGRGNRLDFLDSPKVDNLTFVDLTPDKMDGFTRVKAICDNSIPLYFGKNYQLHNHDIDSKLYIHPMV